MLAVTIDRFKQGLVGRRCLIERREGDWSFDFGDGYTLAVSAPFRVVGKDGIACTSTDHEAHTPQPGGLGSDPFMARLLKKRRVTGVEIEGVTGDLRLTFDGGLRLDVFNDSIGYEGWVASFPTDGDPAVLVGSPGGGCAIPVSVSYGGKGV
ncbi:MAG: hypothetical protein JWP35_456 [Caulobacter sp.]|nr:hypothetical protein [Caulobacter sp.]